MPDESVARTADDFGPRHVPIPPAARRHVIVADDDESIAAIVRKAFQHYDFDCDVVHDGSLALKVTKAMHPDVLVLDINMPGYDGFEVLDGLKHDPETAGVAVVLLSGRRQEADIRRGYALGADDYVVKPFNPMDLTGRVRRLLR